jgi:hypothetical protein
MFYRNYHCKHIVFGGSDSGYAGFLEPYANVAGVNERITILDGPLTPFWLRKTMAQFRSTTFKNVFRTSKISTQPNNGTTAAGVKRSLTDPTPAPERRPSPPMMNGSLQSNPGVNGAVSTRTLPASLATSPRSSHLIYINRYGQRLDPPVSYDKDFLTVLFTSKSKLCNNFYLKGHCLFGDKCQWDHSERLNQVQLDTLRHKARTSACRNPFCVDSECTLGHMCPRGSSCVVGQCKYLPEMHNISMDQVWLLDTVTKEKTLVQLSG